MKRTLFVIALLAAPQLALAQAEPEESQPAAAPEPAAPAEAPAETAPEAPEPDEAAPEEAEPAQADPAEAEPTQAQAETAEPVRAEPVRAEPAPQPRRRPEPRVAPRPEPEPVAEPSRPEPTQAAPVRAEPTQADPVQAEPTQAEPVVEPTLLDTAAPEEAFPVDPAADQALQQGIEDGFADDDLFAPAAEAQEPPVADEHAGEEAAEDAHAAPAGEEAEAHGPNYPAMILNFLIWGGIIVLLLRKPLNTFLKDRRIAIIDGLEEGKRLKEAAAKKHAEYSERLANLDKELEQLRGEMIQSGERERDRIIAEAEARAARMRRDAQFVIDQQMKQLKADLTREAIEAAVKSAEEVLTGQTAAADQERLAKSYLAELESSMAESSTQGAPRDARPAGKRNEVQA